MEHTKTMPTFMYPSKAITVVAGQNCNYKIEKTALSLPDSPPKVKRIRDISELIWRPLTAVLWLLQAYLIGVLSKAAQYAAPDQAVVAWGFVGTQLSLLGARHSVFLYLYMLIIGC